MSDQLLTANSVRVFRNGSVFYLYTPNQWLAEQVACLLSREWACECVAYPSAKIWVNGALHQGGLEKPQEEMKL